MTRMRSEHPCKLGLRVVAVKPRPIAFAASGGHSYSDAGRSPFLLSFFKAEDTIEMRRHGMPAHACSSGLAPMRLSQADRDLIKTTITGRLGGKTRVMLFGSRTDDSRRGGDIDVFVELSEPVESHLRLECAVAAELERAFDGRRVDVLVAAPNLPDRPIDAIARSTGIVL